MLHENGCCFRASPSPPSVELLLDPCSSLNTQGFCCFPGMFFSPEIWSLAPRFHLDLNIIFPFTERSFLNVLSQIAIAHIPTLPVSISYLIFLLDTYCHGNCYWFSWFYLIYSLSFHVHRDFCLFFPLLYPEHLEQCPEHRQYSSVNTEWMHAWINDMEKESCERKCETGDPACCL